LKISFSFGIPPAAILPGIAENDHVLVYMLPFSAMLPGIVVKNGNASA
jgi:hypothetical protein